MSNRYNFLLFFNYLFLTLYQLLTTIYQLPTNLISKSLTSKKLSKHPFRFFFLNKRSDNSCECCSLIDTINYTTNNVEALRSSSTLISNSIPNISVKIHHSLFEGKNHRSNILCKDLGYLSTLINNIIFEMISKEEN